MSLAIAGCADAGTTSAATTAAMAPSDDGTAIVGRVIDEEHRPVPDADVVAVGQSISARTAIDGGFRMSGVSPGFETIVFTRSGYETARKHVEVEAGRATSVLATMERIATVAPHIEAFVGDGWISLGLQAPQVDADNLTYRDKTSFVYEADEGAVAVVSTVVWVPSTPLGANRMTANVRVKGDVNASSGRSPVTARLDGLGVDGPTTASVSFGLEGACSVSRPTDCVTDPPYRLGQLAVEQKARMYTSVFYVQPAPAGFTGVPS